MSTQRADRSGRARPALAALALLILATALTAAFAPAQSHGEEEQEPAAEQAEPKHQGPPPTPVVVDAVRRENLHARRLVTGEIRPRRTSSIATREPGLVLEMAVREGQSVEKGALVARLDDSRLKLELRVLVSEEVVARATLQERESLLEQAEHDLASLAKLAERGAANPKELADARTARQVAIARVSQAKASLGEIASRVKLLRQRISDMTITAPFDGTVLERHTEIGAWVGPGQPLVRLISAGAVEAWLEVPQAVFVAARAGHAPIEVRVDAVGFSTAVRGARVVPEIDPRARVFSVVVPLANEGGVLTPGMSLTAMVAVSAEADQLTVAKDALLRGDAGTYLFVARGGGEGRPATVFPVTVRTLFTVGDRVAVEARGLRAGDLSVVEGNERLFPMTPVMPVKAPGDSPAPAGGARKGR